MKAQSIFLLAALCGILLAQISSDNNWTAHLIATPGTGITVASQIAAADTAAVVLKTVPNSYLAGQKQTFQTDGTNAGVNIASGSLPGAPAAGDLAIDMSGNLNWYDGGAWHLGATADSTLTAGVPVFGNGTNHVTAGSMTGTGSVVMSSSPTINTPLISSFINANHDHTSPANGGAIGITAFAAPTTFATLPACASGIEGARASLTDSTVNTWGATITGGGSYHVLAYCDGTNWTVAGK